MVLLAEALRVEVSDLIEPVHALTDKWRCSSTEVLDAVYAGFRAQVDVLGKLAELKLNEQLIKLRRNGIIHGVEWLDKDNLRDFEVQFRGETFFIECKNIRSGKAVYRTGEWKVELQKTRNSKDGSNTRGYRVDDFDVLAVCTFNQSTEWAFQFAAAADLEARDDPEFLKVFQKVPNKPDAVVWHEHLITALERVPEGES